MPDGFTNPRAEPRQWLDTPFKQELASMLGLERCERYDRTGRKFIYIHGDDSAAKFAKAIYNWSDEAIAEHAKLEKMGVVFTFHDDRVTPHTASMSTFLALRFGGLVKFPELYTV